MYLHSPTLLQVAVMCFYAANIPRLDTRVIRSSVDGQGFPRVALVQEASVNISARSFLCVDVLFSRAATRRNCRAKWKVDVQSCQNRHILFLGSRASLPSIRQRTSVPGAPHPGRHLTPSGLFPFTFVLFSRPRLWKHSLPAVKWTLFSI